MALPELDREFSPSERIMQLNDIDKDVAKLLQSAGEALKALTNKSLPQAPSPVQDKFESVALQSHKEAFNEATTQYFALLSSIDVGLRRQVYALEEAEIIAPEDASKAVGASFGSNVSGATSNAYRGAGALDVGWLNSKKDTVGRDMEAELWRKARELVERHEGKENGRDEDDTKKEPSENMEID